MKGFLIAAPHSGSGKTVLTLALLRAMKNAGIAVSPVKAGPDYIDPAYHQAACGVESFNFDVWAMRADLISAMSSRLIEGDTTLVIEGVMGLFDGAANGFGSSADLADMLSLPVILVVDCARQSHSVAALVEGFKNHRANLYIAGLILNKVGSERHEMMLRQALEKVAIPVLGAVYRNDALALPERHLGLVQAGEIKAIDDFIEKAAEILCASINLDDVMGIAKLASNQSKAAAIPRLAPLGQHIAVARDDAFSFIYPHLLNGWRRRGAEISFFSPLQDEAPLAMADAVYLGGGYPELHCGVLSNATKFKAALHKMAHNGKMVYGECGGYMVLGDALEDKEGKQHPMLGLLPLETSFAKRRLHLGYRALTPLSGFPWAMRLRGHEFHYASITKQNGAQALFQVTDALDKDLGGMGLRKGSVAGSFIHVIDMVEEE